MTCWPRGRWKHSHLCLMLICMGCRPRGGRSVRQLHSLKTRTLPEITNAKWTVQLELLSSLHRPRRGRVLTSLSLRPWVELPGQQGCDLLLPQTAYRGSWRHRSCRKRMHNRLETKIAPDLSWDTCADQCYSGVLKSLKGAGSGKVLELGFELGTPVAYIGQLCCPQGYWCRQVNLFLQQKQISVGRVWKLVLRFNWVHISILNWDF